MLELHAGSSQRAARFGYVVAEGMDAEDLGALLPLLAKQRVDVVWAWPFEMDQAETQRRFEVVRQSEQLGVWVRPWPLLTEEEGLWPSSENVALFDARMREFLQAWMDADLTPTMFLVDMEMPLSRALQLSDKLAAWDLVGGAEFLRSFIDRQKFAEATLTYAALVDDAHALGWKVELSTLQIVLDDYDDGDDGLKQGLSIPVDGIDWDLVTFQIFRSMAIDSSNLPLDASFTFDYALRSKLRFGERAGVVVGINDPGDVAGDVLTFTDPRETAEDVEAARAAGIAPRDVGLYQLRGIVRSASPEAWFAPSDRRIFSPVDPGTLLVRSANASMDLSL